MTQFALSIEPITFPTPYIYATCYVTGLFQFTNIKELIGLIYYTPLHIFKCVFYVRVKIRIRRRVPYFLLNQIDVTNSFSHSGRLAFFRPCLRGLWDRLGRSLRFLEFDKEAIFHSYSIINHFLLRKPGIAAVSSPVRTGRTKYYKYPLNGFFSMCGKIIIQAC